MPDHRSAALGRNLISRAPARSTNMSRRSDRRHAISSTMNPSLPELDVSPLIDVSFLLLIFFLVTSSLRKEEADLTTAFPTGETTPTAVEPLTVEIGAKASGEVTFNGNIMETSLSNHRLPRLVSELKASKRLAKASETPIMARIDIADDASQQRFADVLNALTAAEIENIAIHQNP